MTMELWAEPKHLHHHPYNPKKCRVAGNEWILRNERKKGLNIYLFAFELRNFFLFKLTIGRISLPCWIIIVVSLWNFHWFASFLIHNLLWMCDFVWMANVKDICGSQHLTLTVSLNPCLSLGRGGKQTEKQFWRIALGSLGNFKLRKMKTILEVFVLLDFIFSAGEDGNMVGLWVGVEILLTEHA